MTELSDDELAAELDDEFDDWDVSQQEQGQEEQGDGDHGNRGDKDDIEGDAWHDEEGQSDAEGQASDGWGSDGDPDAMAEQLLGGMESPLGYRHAGGASAGAGPSMQVDEEEGGSRQQGGRGLAEEEEGEAHASPAKKRRTQGPQAGASGGTTAGQVSHGADNRPGQVAQGVSEQAAAGKAGQAAGAAACTHPTYWAGMCVVCGAPKPDELEAGSSGQGGADTGVSGASGRKQPSRGRPSGRGGANSGGTAAGAAGAGAGGGAGPGAGGGGGGGVTRIKHMHASAHLELSSDEAERLRQQDVARLLAARRLVLILDLDHTLLNSVRLMDVAQEQLPALNAILDKEAGNPRRLLHCLRDKNLW